ncbi:MULTISPECIES: DUF6673 family protein [Clostridium]|uniref:AP endonuclease n=1 Tax=Clostridium cibarium TaxID=2762247 RepID=A0ABR8PV20_9CLOT|nr:MULTISPECIES: DUF6673 family protein [Clostridium]MBD7912015.1 AP endonuclease [Clostridium cibarium]
MVINGVELEELDIFDANTMERYEKAMDKVVKSTQEYKELKGSEIVRKECEVIFKCFNELFGEGTDKKIFGDKINIITCLKAFEELVEQINSKQDELEKLTSKYSPNRAKRRSKK